ncbi:MAG: hypothetical protein PHH04_03775 [Thomasclavelia sp.]|nr:hypothetical protein [Thomasclavelia sp.]
MKKKKVLKYLFITLGCIAFIALGAILGTVLEKKNNDNINSQYSKVEEIAVVNMDEGIKVDDKRNNYAAEIVKELDDDTYTVTSLSEAKEGLKDEKYAAYVIIPANFSRSVNSINNTPTKSTLEYKIGGDLTKDANSIAYANVMKLREKFNNNVGYMYLNSIIDKYHEGQDSASKVLANEKDNQDVIAAINDIDLVSTVNISDLTRLQNNVQELDISPDIETNRQIINKIDTAYKTYLARTKADYQKIVQQNTQSDNELTQVVNNNNTLASVNDPSGNIVNANDYITQKTSENSTLLTSITEALNTTDVTVDSSTTSLSNAYKSNVKTHLTTMDNQQTLSVAVLNNLTNDQLNALNANPNVQAALQQINASYTTIQQYLNDVNNGTITVITKATIDTDIQGMLNSSIDNTNTSLQTVKTNNDGISIVNTNLKTKIADLKVALDAYATNKVQLTTVINSYDPESYIDKNEIAGYVRDYNTNNEALSVKIKNKESEYITFTNEVYNDADHQLTTIRNDVVAWQEDTNKKIQDALGNAKNVSAANLNTNTQLMNDYITSLSNTRNGTKTDTDVTKLILESARMTGGHEKESNILGWNLLLLFAIITLLSGALSGTTKWLSKKEENEPTNEENKF